MLQINSILTRARPMLESGVWAGLTTLSKAASQLIVVKWIALNFGPATLGVTGQAMSLIAILQALAGGGIANAIIRRFAIDTQTSSEDFRRQQNFLSASFTYGLIFSTLFLAVALLLKNQISNWAFDTKDYGWFVLLLGLSSYFSFLASFAQSLLSAKSLVRNIFWANALGLASGVVVFALLTNHMAEPGILLGLLAIMIFPACFFMVQLMGRSWFSFASLKPNWNPSINRTLVPFTLIATIGSALAPIIFVLLRSGIEDKMGWDHVGYWQAILKVSDFIFSFIGLLIASTFYPRVAAAKTTDEAVAQALQFALPFTALLACGLFITGFFGETVLSLIYSDAYRFLKSDLNVLLFGGFFRALAWLSAYFLMARNHLKMFLTFEVIGSISLYAVCSTSLNYGFSALIWGQVIQSVFYLVILMAGVSYMKYTKRL
jgi:PST family polysaccharide transporter